MPDWQNLGSDDFKDKDSAPLSTDVRKRKTPDSRIHGTHKRFRLPDECESADNLDETLRQPEHANYSVSNTNKTLRPSGQGWGDENVRLQAEVNLLKELIELKDEQLQEWAVRSNVDQFKWREEGCKLTEENFALRNEVCTLKKNALCLEHEVDGLKKANDDLFNRIADSCKRYVSKGIQAVTSNESPNVHHLMEENRTLHTENNDLRSEFRLCLEGNHALSEDVARLHAMVTSKDKMITAWERMGEEWKSQESDFQRDLDILRRASEGNVHRVMDEKQRPLEIATSEATNTLSRELDDSLVMIPSHDVSDTDEIPLKRKRGRPKGSKNKNPKLASIRVALDSGVKVPKGKPGRPPKGKRPPALGPDGEPLSKRRPGRPPKFRRPDGTHTQNSNLTHPAEVHEPNSSKASYDLPFEGLVSDGDSAPRDITDGQVPLPIKETVLDTEISAPLDQNGEDTSQQMEVESHNLDGGGMIKLEHNRSPGLTERHLELIYHTENGKLFCILCERTRVPGTPIVSFHTGTPHQTLLEHCNVHHPRECTKFVLMSPEKLADMRDRYVESMPANSKIIE